MGLRRPVTIEEESLPKKDKGVIVVTTAVGSSATDDVSLYSIASIFFVAASDCTLFSWTGDEIEGEGVAHISCLLVLRLEAGGGGRSSFLCFALLLIQQPQGALFLLKLELVTCKYVRAYGQRGKLQRSERTDN